MMESKGMRLKALISAGILILLSVLISGCVQQGGSKSMKPEIAMAPTIDVEATVISLSLDTRQECEGKCLGYPNDRGLILIEKVIATTYPPPIQPGGPEAAGAGEIKGFEVGNKVEVSFYYSARPSKIVYVPAPVREPQPQTTTVTAPLKKPIPKVDAYFIYTIESNLVDQPTEVILPGLQIGAKIRATITYDAPSKGTIGRYEIMQ